MRLMLLILLTSFVFPVYAQPSLPDTGMAVCRSTTNSSSSPLVSCNQENAGDVGANPHQDGRHGRDAVATAGKLVKMGGGDGGFDYSKICNSGELEGVGSCPVNPNLGNGTNDWGCVLDNITELMWEVKTSDIPASLRDQSWRYSWFNSDNATNGNNSGIEDAGDNCFDIRRCDTEKFIADVNTSTLCSFNDWRLPSYRELTTLLHLGKSEPRIDTDYFPETQVLANGYWSATTFAIASGTPNSWSVSFLNTNESNGKNRSTELPVRLVRQGAF